MSDDDKSTPKKSDRRPWETQPHVDGEAATEKALAAAATQSPVPKRSDRLPWETQPHVDGEAATGKALAAAATQSPVPKPRKLAWETEPWVDHQGAQKQAITAAQPPAVDPNSAVVQSYARKAFDDEIGFVTNALSGGRNDTLFKAAANLFELVYAGALDETEVVAALRDACHTNRYIPDDGESAFDKTLAQAQRRGRDNPRDLSNVGTRARAGDVYADDDEPKPLVFDDFRRLERGFWLERDSLQHVYLGALSRMCSPWAVLANCAARALAQVRPHVTLPPVIGGPGSLNWFAAVAAHSGGGKSASEDAATDLVKMEAAVRERNLGSGEGLLDAYVRPPDKESDYPGGMHESVMFTADEGDILQALGSRKGSTLPGTLRSAFTGKTVGFSYRTNDRHLDARTYRLTLVVNIQPAKAGVLLDDTTGGLLQRFMWFPGSDPRVDSQNPPWPGQLTLPSPQAWLYPCELTIPYEAVELIRDGVVARNRGEANPLDGHALHAREKFAFALAVLDGRAVMNSDDWRLAGVAMKVSDFVRRWVTQELERAQADDAAREGRTMGQRRFAADTEQTRQSVRRRDQIRRRIGRLIVEKLTATGNTGLTEGALKQMFRGEERTAVVDTLKWLAEHDKVTMIDRAPKDGTDRWAALP
ncbi:MAG: DUF3987 domain-containing protein [Mycobacterium sp.]